MQAALGHEGEQTDGFQGHGLTAGVGAGDDQCIKITAQIQIVADSGLGVQQRMAGLTQLDEVTQRRLHSPHFGGQLGPGEDAVQSDEGAVIFFDAPLEVGAVGGQLRQNALDLLLLLELQLLQLVVGVDHAHRLNEEGAAGAGHIVDQTGDLVFVLALDGHHVAPAAHGDDGLLQVLGLVGRDQLVQHIAHLTCGGADVTADIRQFGGGGVGDLILGQDGAGDLLLQKTVGGQALKIAVQHRLFLTVADTVLPHIAGAAEHLGNVQQLPGIQRAAAVGTLQGRRHRTDADEGGRAVFHQQSKRRRGLALETGHLTAVGAGAQGSADLLALLGGGFLRQHSQHSGQFQRVDGFFK